MSMYDYSLICNFPKCRGRLSGFAWVTACSHIFCDRHGSGEFSRTPAICPACSSALSGKLDIVRTELAPSEQYKAMVLVGLRPETVLDISHRALAFWTYQVRFVLKLTHLGQSMKSSGKLRHEGGNSRTKNEFCHPLTLLC